MMPGEPPLKGLRVVELAGLAPGPFCGLLLASHGASVLRIDRSTHPTIDTLTSRKSSLVLNLKSPRSRTLLLSLLAHADILIDPFRPGVLESLSLFPATLLQQNPRLILVRLTGFRRTGPYAHMAGHDINYLAVSGVLSLLGPKGAPPLPPGNILADFAGGGHVAFTGVLLALFHRQLTGRGQIVEANMVDGVGFLATFPRLARKTSLWEAGRGENLPDGGAPFYGCYECKDLGRYVAVGALEEAFWRELLRGLGLSEKDVLPEGFDGSRNDKASWGHMRQVFTKKFKEKTREEWEAMFTGTDACVTPVLEYGELEEQGYEQVGIVGMSESPGLVVEEQYAGGGLRPGDGGERVLGEWLGWRTGREFEVSAEGGWAEVMERSKL